jgi:hypothetical protein
MGRLRLIGGVTKKEYQLVEETANVVKLKNVIDGVDYATFDSTTIKDAGGVALNSHASRHAYGGADALPSDSLRIAQVALILGAGSSVSVSPGGTYTIPKGIHYIFLGPNTRLELYDDIATAWKTAIAAGGAGIVISDGSNARLYNSGTASESSNIRSFT